MPGFFRLLAKAVAFASVSLVATTPAHAVAPHYVTATSGLGSITVNDVLSLPGGDPAPSSWAIWSGRTFGGYVNTQATTVGDALRIAAPGNIPDPTGFRTEQRATVGFTFDVATTSNTNTRLDIDVPLLTQFAQPDTTGLAITLAGSAFYSGTSLDRGVRVHLQLNGLNAAGQSVSLLDTSLDSFADKASPFLFNVDALVPVGFDVKRLTGQLTAEPFTRPGAVVPPNILMKTSVTTLATLDSMTIRAVTSAVPETGTLAMMGLGLVGLLGLRARRHA